jgi:hypothetical protein
MKIAKVSIVTIDVQCPHCQEGIEHPESGSLNWEVIAVRETIYRCQECDKYCKLPKTVGSMLL